jgi:hypothetical protein
MSYRTRTEDKHKYERDSIIKVEHVWHESSDRWIYIERYNDDTIGLNFMQGFEYDYFANDYAFVDKALSDFYYENKNSFREFEHDSEINLIDKVMWVYHDAIRFYNHYN